MKKRITILLMMGAFLIGYLLAKELTCLRLESAAQMCIDCHIF